MNKVYMVTNENLTALQRLYNFDNQNVLTVLGSGDQYFSSLLFGAKKVDVFDYNFLTWYYFCLKFMAIRNLDYDTFYDFLVKDKLSDLTIYDKIRSQLPEEVRMYFDYLKVIDKPFGENAFSSLLFKAPSKHDDTKIPYYSEENYKKLQNILQLSDLPEFYNCDIVNLNKDKSYDLALFSNIFAYLPFDILEYRDFLSEFNISTIEAYYAWKLSFKEQKEFLAQGFTLDLVDPVLRKQRTKDCVVTLRKE